MVIRARPIVRLSNLTQAAIGNLRAARKARLRKTFSIPTFPVRSPKTRKRLRVATGIAAASLFAYKAIQHKAVMGAVISLAQLAALGLGVRYYFTHRKQIRWATQKVANALQAEVRGGNKQLEDFLRAHQYVVVTRDGSLKGINYNNPLGRLRISTQELVPQARSISDATGHRSGPKRSSK